MCVCAAICMAAEVREEQNGVTVEHAVAQNETAEVGGCKARTYFWFCGNQKVSDVQVYSSLCFSLLIYQHSVSMCTHRVASVCTM